MILGKAYSICIVSASLILELLYLVMAVTSQSQLNPSEHRRVLPRHTGRTRSEMQKFPAFVPRFIVSFILTGRDRAFNRFVLGLAVALLHVKVMKLIEPWHMIKASGRHPEGLRVSDVTVYTPIHRIRRSPSRMIIRLYEQAVWCLGFHHETNLSFLRH